MKRLSPARFSAVFALALHLVLSCASCGLDVIVYLAEETKVLDRGVSSLILQGPESDDESYAGLMVFYKIYANESSATTDYSYVISKQSAENVVPGAIVESYLASTGGLNYQQIVLRNDIPIPSILKSNLTLDYYTAIEFPADIGEEPTLTIYEDSSDSIVASFILKRSSRGSDGSYLSFRDEPASGDAD